MRLIDADELIKKALDEAFFDSAAEDTFCELVETAPTVYAVEVVRCKDCKYWEHARQNKGICKPPSASHGGYCVRRGATVETDYCSYGERKGKNHDY